MKKTITLILTAIIISSPVLSQDLLWSHSTNDNDLTSGSFIKVDMQDNVYVGASGTGKMYLIRYSSEGMPEFMVGDNVSYKYNAMTLDNNGKAYMIGSKDQGNGFEDGLMHVFYQDGTACYSQVFDNVSQDDVFEDIMIDAGGNVYVTGLTSDVVNQYSLLVKYSPSGNQVWMDQYGTMLDKYLANNIKAGYNDDLFVVGAVLMSGTGNTDLFVLQYDTAGNVMDSNTINFPGFTIAMPVFILVDEQNNLYVGGVLSNGPTLYAGFLLKYTSGQVAWSRIIESPFNYCIFYDGTFDHEGNIVVCGAYWKDNSDAYYAKISPSGSIINQEGFAGPGDGADVFKKVVCKYEYTYMCGGVHGIGTGSDFYVLKVNSAGEKQWDVRYNGSGIGDDYAEDICLDAGNNVLVTGRSDEGGVMNSTTLKYSNSLGIGEPVKRPTEIKLIKNPVQNCLSFQMDVTSGSPEYEVLNLMGQRLSSGQLEKNTFHRIYNIPEESGIYFLRITDGSNISLARFIKE